MLFAHYSADACLRYDQLFRMAASQDMSLCWDTLKEDIYDFIPRDAFSLHYSSVNDAVRLLLTTGPGALMAKADLKSAFRMIPVRRQDWELRGYAMEWRILFRHLSPLWAPLIPVPLQRVRWCTPVDSSLQLWDVQPHPLPGWLLSDRPSAVLSMCHPASPAAASVRSPRHSGCHGQSRRACYLTHLPRPWAWFCPTADPAATHQAGRDPHGTARLVTPHQGD